jgi:hypothetical protein
MSGSTRFVTYVNLTLGDRWQWTAPRATPGSSYKSAENMVAARIMEDRGISRSFPNFSIRLRQLYPEIVKEARGYIGETREVVLEVGMTPKEFQRRFHEVRC